MKKKGIRVFLPMGSITVEGVTVELNSYVRNAQNYDLVLRNGDGSIAACFAYEKIIGYMHVDFEDDPATLTAAPGGAEAVN